MRTENTPGLEKPVTFCGLILQEPKKDNVFHILIQHLWMTLGSQKFWEIPPKNDVLNVHGIRSPTDPGHVWCLMPGSQWPFLKRYLSKHQNLPCIHLSHVRIVYEFMKSCILMFRFSFCVFNAILSSVWCSKTSKQQQQQQQQNEYGQIFTGLYVTWLCNRLTARSLVCYTTQIDIGTTIQFYKHWILCHNHQTQSICLFLFSNGEWDASIKTLKHGLWISFSPLIIFALSRAKTKLRTALKNKRWMKQLEFPFSMKLGMCMYQCFSRAKQCGWTNQNRSGSGVSQQTSCKHYHSRLVLAVRQGYQTNYKKTSLSSPLKMDQQLYRPLDFGSAILPKIGDANKRFMTFYDHNSKNMLLTFVNTIDVWGNMTTSIQINTKYHIYI
jgi:hypothetical protein